MTQRLIDRRLFVQGLSAATLAASSSLAYTQTRPQAPMRIGIIGPGSRGQELVRNFLRVPNVSIVAAADVYPARFESLNHTCGYRVASHADYRALLDRRDLDAIIVATPLSFHSEHVIAALESGHHTYGEKTMAFTVAEAQAIVSTVERTRRIYQVGHQYRYSPWIQAAVARVFQGEIGKVTEIHAYWHRNNDWRRPVPNPSLERLINWRLYNQYSLGLLAELASHHIDIANWVFGEGPQAAFASGSIAAYPDGRETDDNVQAILSYSEGRRFLFSSMTNNSKLGDQLWLYGSKGSLNLTLEDATFFYEPKQIVKPPVVGKGEDKGITTGASYRTSGEMPYRGPGKPVAVTTAEDPTTAACRAFIQCVRTGTEPIANARVGLRAALGVIQADQARIHRREMPIPTVS
jgi:predicted dehydrogenase